MSSSISTSGSKRGKGGRPALPAAKRHEKPITIRLTNECYAQLLQHAQERQVPLAKLIRQRLEETPDSATSAIPYSAVRNLKTMSSSLLTLAMLAEREGFHEVQLELLSRQQELHYLLNSLESA